MRYFLQLFNNQQVSTNKKHLIIILNFIAMKKVKWYYFLIAIVGLSIISEYLSKDEAPRLKPIINYYDIAGHTPEEVEKILGKGKFEENINDKKANCTGNNCPQYNYKGDIDIVFINGKADWITINNLSKYDYSEKAIELIGVVPTTPYFSNNFAIRFKKANEYNEVSIFENGNKKISYIYIKAVTE